MTNRSTRNKLRFQCGKILNDLDRAQGHLKYLDDLAEGESAYINQQLPNLVSLVENMKVIIIAFREGL